MARVYRQFCEHCGRWYESHGKRFCSRECAAGFLGSPRERWERAVPDRPEGGCWIWQGAVGGTGYGEIKVCGRQEKAHRFAYAEFVGAIASGRNVLHHCDVPRCVNPEHLYVGTAADNNRDTRERGRFVASPGERNGGAKLAAADIETIRWRYGLGFSEQSELAYQYGITQQTVSEIVTRRIWRHV